MNGLDLLGLGSPAWDLKSTLKALPDGWAVGCFDTGWPNSFGDPWPKLKRILDTGKCPAVRIQIWWDPTHKIVPLDKLKQRLKTWTVRADAYPSVKFYISPSCEYLEPSIKAVKARVDAVKNYPNLIPVLTPMNSPVIPGVITEEHGAGATAGVGQIASTDGQSIYDIDADRFRRNNKNAIISFLWGMRCNGAESHNTLPPNRRTAFPGLRYLRGMIALAESEGSAPTPNFSGEVVPIKKPYLWKTFAEDMQGANSRDNKPLLIVKGAQTTCQIVDVNGKKVGTLKVFDAPGMYPGGLTRYYSGLPGAVDLYAYQVQAISKWIWFKVGSTYYGPVNAAFRRGFFQA